MFSTAAGNLISVKRLQKAGISVEFNSNGFTIYNNGLAIVKNSDALDNIPIVKFQAYTADKKI